MFQVLMHGANFALPCWPALLTIGPFIAGAHESGQRDLRAGWCSRTAQKNGTSFHAMSAQTNGQFLGLLVIAPRSGVQSTIWATPTALLYPSTSAVHWGPEVGQAPGTEGGGGPRKSTWGNTPFVHIKQCSPLCMHCGNYFTFFYELAHFQRELN